MVYEWARHKEEIRRLYLDENRTLKEVQAHLETTYGFSPRYRAYQLQLKKWGFSKLDAGRQPRVREGDADILSRLKKLWAQNMSRPQMVAELQKQGFQTTHLEVTKLCNANGLRMRQGPRGRARPVSDQSGRPRPPTDYFDPSFSSNGIIQALPAQPSSELARPSLVAAPTEPSNAQRQNKFRRDKTRFPSDMTVMDARHQLKISRSEFCPIRDDFLAICNSMGVRDKSKSREKWDDVKLRLMHKHPDLYPKLWTPSTGIETNQRAFDTLCMNILKVKRLTDNMMTQQDAKNVLKMNPTEAREARDVFYNLLTETGLDGESLRASLGRRSGKQQGERWKHLNSQWGNRCPKIGQALEKAAGHPDGPKIEKALRVLSGDVLKRACEQRPSRQPKQQHLGQSAPPSSQAHTDQTYVDGVNPHPQPDPQPPPTGAGPGHFLLPESSDASQTMSSPDSGIMMAPYPLVQHPFGSQSFAVHPQQAVAPQPMFVFTANPNMTAGVPHYMPPLPVHAPVSFSSAPYASQPHENVSFSEQMLMDWLSFFGDQRPIY
ncbi:hypothetical protein V8C35DRAFT_286741 [Trichoderma chlorosporum]